MLHRPHPLLSLVVLAISMRFAAAADLPTRVVRELNDAAVAVLRQKDLPVDAKRREIHAIVERHVDFNTMSRLVLARNWSRLTDDQKTEFVEQFRNHLSATYGKNIESYRDERVEITGDRDEGRGDWTVQTKILRSGGAGAVLVDYRLRMIDGEWKVIDLLIERVSLVSNFRSQFQDIVANGGIDRLLRELREKNGAEQVKLQSSSRS